MKIHFLVVTSIILLSSCSTKPTPIKEDFGVFLGANEAHSEEMKKYQNVALEIEEFSSSSIKKLKDNNTNIYAYLSIGALEKYKDYYNDFKNYTFLDYENWPEERWIDVSQVSWQDKLLSLASDFKNMGATGIFMDNFDVYYIVNEKYECSSSFKEGIYNGCLSILNKLSSLNMSLLINSGTDFLERMSEENNPLINKIDWYAQECVFSNIIDYDHDIFSKQDKETQDYYFSIISFMKRKSKILLIEYTKDAELKKEIEAYCKNNKYSCYISDTVNLD